MKNKDLECINFCLILSVFFFFDISIILAFIFSQIEMLEKAIFFDKWNKDKKTIDNNRITVFAKPRDICYIKLGINVGFEENGKDNFLRPVIIMSKIGSLYFILPLTSQEKNNKYHYHIKSISFNNKKSFAILSQGRVIDGKRLIDKQGVCNSTEFLYLKKNLRSMYFPE